MAATNGVLPKERVDDGTFGRFINRALGCYLLQGFLQSPKVSKLLSNANQTLQREFSHLSAGVAAIDHTQKPPDFVQ